MSKRGGRGRWINKNLDSYDDYNERHTNHHTKRRVSFKHNYNYNNENLIVRTVKNRAGWEAAVKLLNDDDIDMGANAAGGAGRGNYRGFRGRGGRRDGRLHSPGPRMGTSRRLIPGPSPWYQVMIPFGQKHDKETILRALLSAIAPDVFIPHYYKTTGNAAVFYVDDFAVAEKLFNADRKVNLPDGYKMVVKVKSGTPHVTVDDSLIEKMKLAMVKRYNPAVKALDLTKFHADADLTDVFCALFRPTIMLSVIDIISQNIPDLEALNLSDNKLNNLDTLRTVPTKLKCLKILYVGNNRHSRTLDVIKGMPIVELQLEGNPFVEKCKEKEGYVSDIRRVFPKLLKLDGADLPPTIGFDVPDEEYNIPTAQASFLCNTQGQVIVRQFLEQYYALYDSDSRQQLLAAYHEQAMVSMNAAYGQGQNQSSSNNRLNQYFPNSRNLMRILDRDVRRRHIKIGRLQVVSFLSDLPKTQHDPLSFCVDLSIFTPSLIMLTINGVFKEKGSNAVPVIRAFHRTMLIVPNTEGGICIQNDMLFITNATRQQEETSFKETITLNPVPPMVAPTPTPAPSSEAAKMQLLQSLSEQTGMNLHWSTNCLEQTNWDLNRGLLIFSELHKEGKIPPEAFVK